MLTFRKQGSPAGIATEAASLRWLADAGPDAAPVAELVAVGPDWLETRLLDTGTPGPTHAAEFGRRLALTHAAGADFWGQAPPGLDPADARLADLPAPAVAAPTWRTWGEFHAEARLQPYLDIAAERHHVDAAAAGVLQAGVDAVASGARDSPHPSAVPAGRVARVHGDLWAGNVVWARHGGHVAGTLIDPSAHGGHAETDLAELAELALFGAPRLVDIVAGYQEVSRLADGWQERVPLHQFHMLLVHVAIFGGGYVQQAVDVAGRLS